jgi:signal transduction histidine kinase
LLSPTPELHPQGRATTIFSGSAVAGTGRTGLGLDHFDVDVEAHGGRIWAESRVGASNFHFTLPS